jgi:hypothetical protein
MWHGRGEPQLGEPLGSVIELPGTPTVALLSNRNAAWPDSNANYNYTGYEIDKSGHPVIKYSIGKTQVRELLTAENSGKQLTHTITVVSSDSDEVWCHVAQGRDITKLPNGLYAVNDKQYFVQFPEKVEPLIRKAPDNTIELLLPVKTKNSNASVKYSIIW